MISDREADLRLPSPAASVRAAALERAGLLEQRARATVEHLARLGVSTALRPWISKAFTPSSDSIFCTA